MRTCTKCCQEKPLADFYKMKTGKFGTGAECKECRKAYMSARGQLPEVQERVRKRLGHDVIQSLKEASPCMDCGNSYSHYVMDFDHRPGEIKLFGLASPNHTLAARLEELKKCDLVCANCHRVRTWKGKTRSCKT